MMGRNIEARRGLWRSERIRSRRRSARPVSSPVQAGFTLLEVIVSLAILAIGAALTLSLISGSLGNIRKVQMRARIVQHAESVMELALLDESIRQPTTYTGDFEDGTRWIVHVDEYEMPDLQLQTNVTGQTKLPRLYAFSVDVTGPDSSKPDFHLQTLKMINTDQKAMSPELPK